MFKSFACGVFDAKGCEESVWVFLYTFLVPTLLAVGIGLGIISLLLSAVSLITSTGDSKATEEALEKLKGTFIGLVIVIIAFTIIQIIISTVSGGTPVYDISGGLKK